MIDFVPQARGTYSIRAHAGHTSAWAFRTAGGHLLGLHLEDARPGDLYGARLYGPRPIDANGRPYPVLPAVLDVDDLRELATLFNSAADRIETKARDRA